MLTLWDLLDPLLSRLKSPPALAPKRPPQRGRRPAAPPHSRPPEVRRRRQLSAPAPNAMQVRYEVVARDMLAEHNIRVRKWRKNMSGIAWYVTYQDGRRVNLIEAPRPLGPMSIAIFLHEIGHHAIGFNVYKPRCLEEFHAWRWALEAMQAHNLNITDAVRHRVHRSLWYAVQKAERRGIKRIPDELTPFLEKPASRRRSRV